MFLFLEKYVNLFSVKQHLICKLSYKHLKGAHSKPK